ncbi:hypothetical protein ATZ36_09290 [Candidatus Endomicrobiellum trichonymphae]|jgi:hypothetical protein|uniref:Uncharacterized protein n=1 Tax=Endomicrobium trichonymphae TaxID=1408204 RepID=A0A1E5IG53_ENDTX|nr:hypothetical protein ATZ36_09290 [Candidatus Endomicrobium trichonymphae]
MKYLLDADVLIRVLQKLLFYQKTVMLWKNMRKFSNIFFGKTSIQNKQKKSLRNRIMPIRIW